MWREVPQVQVIDMASRLKRRQIGLPAALAEALQETTERGEKSVLLLNRRGFCKFFDVP